MPKGNILDRLAADIRILENRRNNVSTPRQRYALAQRWNALRDIGAAEEDKLWESGRRPESFNTMNALRRMGLRGPDMGVYTEPARNPFLSDNFFEYEEQNDFLNFCKKYGLEPNESSLKTYRWEIYKRMNPDRQRRVFVPGPNARPSDDRWYAPVDMPDDLPSDWRYR